MHDNHEFRSHPPTAERGESRGANQRAPRQAVEFRESPPHGDWIERRAKLFEAGVYPDKGVTITPEHLEAIAEAFREPVPVLIEHSESPLELGFLTKVEALDGELFGTVSLSREAHDLVESSGARSLSIGLSADLSEIREVSLVRNPRIPDAQLFSGIRFCGSLEESSVPGDPSRWNAAHDFGRFESGRKAGEKAQGSPGPAPGTLHMPADQDEPEVSGWRARYESLRAQLQSQEAKRKVEEFVRAGKLCPAQAPFAESLLRSEDTIEFGEDMASVRQLLIAMIERQPPLQLFSSLAPTPDRAAAAALLLPEEADFYRRHFPDVSLDEIAARKSR